MNLETLWDLGMEGEHSKPHTSISDEDLEKQCNEESDGMQSIDDPFQSLSPHADVPYYLQQIGAYTQSYYHKSPFE